MTIARLTKTAQWSVTQASFSSLLCCVSLFSLFLSLSLVRFSRGLFPSCFFFSGAVIPPCKPGGCPPLAVLSLSVCFSTLHKTFERIGHGASSNSSSLHAVRLAWTRAGAFVDFILFCVAVTRGIKRENLPLGFQRTLACIRLLTRKNKKKTNKNERHKMAEYCEYMWFDSARGHNNAALARSIYEERGKLDKRDKQLAINIVRAILRHRPDVDLENCTDEYITRFLLARKYRTEQAAALIVAYQAQVLHRQDIFGNLTARDPALQRALRAGIPGVLPARDRKGRCVLVILASQWDPTAVPALSVQRAIFLVLEILIQDPRNQQAGFVAVVDWSGFSLRQGSALGAAALRNLIAALRGRFPARFKAIHFLSAPLYVQATLALVKPFLDEKTRNKIYLHGNNLSTLHEHLPTDILPAELGGTGPAFNPGLWAEPVIRASMKDAEQLAAAKKEKEQQQQQQVDEANECVQEPADLRSDVSKTTNGNERQTVSDAGTNVLTNAGKTSPNNSTKRSSGKTAQTDVEMNVINTRSGGHKETTGATSHDEDNVKERLVHIERVGNNNDANETRYSDDRTDQLKNADDFSFLDAEVNSNEFEIISNRIGSESSKDSSLDNRLEGKALIVTGNNETPSEETNLIT